MKQKRTRETLMTFYVSADEEEKINKKIAAAIFTNMSAYLINLSIDGIIVRLDDPEIKELISLLTATRDRLDEILGRMEDCGEAGRDDLDDIRSDQKKLTELANSILFRLAAIK